jgi:hypothetical protein
MTLDKQYLYNYGATGLKSFFDRNFNKPTMFQTTINPNKARLFYTAALFHQAGGIQNAGFILEEQKLLYKIKVVGQPDSVISPLWKD